MKKFIFALIIIILIAAAGFAAWGFWKAEQIKAQAEQVQQIVSPTLNLSAISNDEVDIPVQAWQDNAEKAEEIKNELSRFDKTLPALLKQDFNRFYSSENQKRLDEVELLKFLVDNQNKIDFQNSASQKSKGQIETVLSDVQKFSSDFGQLKQKFSGTNFEVSIVALTQEESDFENYLKELGKKMTYKSAPVSVDSTALNQAYAELKTELLGSLNDWVSLQEEIKQNLPAMGKSVWVNPLNN